MFRTPAHVLFSAFLLGSGGTLAAQEAMPALPAAAQLAPARRHMLYDAPGDGSVWAKGRTYKMEFAAGATRFFPVLGRRAPYNFPLGLRLVEVTDAGDPVPIWSGATPQRDGDTIAFEHGCVREVWRLELNEAEQDFVFAPGALRGEVRVRLAVETPLQVPVKHQGGGLFFAAADLGGVFYGDALVYDGEGQRLALPVAYCDGHLEITVPAAFTARARGAITVDPLVRALVVDNSAGQQDDPHVAYEAGAGVWLVVYTEEVALNDRDIISRRLNAAGTVLEEVAVSLTADDSVGPDVAANHGARQFLIVWQDSNLISSQIKARTRDAASTQQGATLTLIGSALGNVFDVQVGGASEAGATQYFAVWVDARVAGTVIQGCRISTSGIAGSPLTVANYVARSAFLPAISKSSGPGQRWVTVFRTRGLQDEDISGVAIGGSGTVIGSTVTLSSPGQVPADPAVAGDGNEFLAVWEGDSNNGDIHGRRLRITSSLVPTGGILNLTAAEPGTALSTRQFLPQVAWQGCRYAYSYHEGATGLRAAAVVPTNNSVAFVEGHVALATTNLAALRSSIASVEEGGEAFVGKALVVYGRADIEGAIYDSVHPGGGITTLATGCGGIRFEPGIAATGVPALGGSFSVSITVGSDLPLLMIGTPVPPVALCAAGCQLAVNPLINVAGASVTLPVPCDGHLLLGRVAIQGAQVILSAATTACGPPTYGVSFRTTDTIIATLQ